MEDLVFNIPRSNLIPLRKLKPMRCSNQPLNYRKTCAQLGWTLIKDSDFVFSPCF